MTNCPYGHWDFRTGKWYHNELLSLTREEQWEHNEVGGHNERRIGGCTDSTDILQDGS